MNFKKICQNHIIEWDLIPQNQRPKNGSLCIAFFYLGKYDQAREISEMYSAYKYRRYQEDKRTSHLYDWAKMKYLFDAALYASLADKPDKAEVLWYKVIDQRRGRFPKNQVTEYKTAEVWLYEAYALLKLGKYNEAENPATIGLKGILDGKGPSTDEHVYKSSELFANLILKFIAYKLQPNSNNKQKLQEILEVCRQHGIENGGIDNYIIIFDLQFSYPDDIVRVLPGEDPDDD